MTQLAETEQSAGAQRDLVDEFTDAYAAALADAAVAAEHTQTAGWRYLYQEHLRSDREIRRHAAAQIRAVADTLADRFLSEAEEKQLGDLRRLAIERREFSASFDRQAVDPVIRPVEAGAKVISKYASAARRLADDNPLLASGVEERMRRAIEMAAKIHWNADEGVVTITA